MNSAPDDFDQLRKMLAFKRHEVPPPGYFDRLPDIVIARLEGQSVEGAAPLVWLQRVWEAFGARPAVAGVFGVLMGGLLLSGLYYSNTMQPSASAVGPSFNETWPLIVPEPAKAIALKPDIVERAEGASTNPVLTTPPAGLFDAYRLSIQPVSFDPSR